MTFIWPPMLLAVALVPIGALLYWALDRRRHRLLATRGGLGLAQGTTRRPAGLRSRAPSALILVGMAVIAVAMARPQAVVDLPRVEGTVILAFERHGAHTNGCGQDGGEGLRGAPAGRHINRCRGVQRLGRVGPDAYHRSGHGALGDRPPDAGAWDVSRPGHPGLAQRHCRCGSRALRGELLHPTRSPLRRRPPTWECGSTPSASAAPPARR